MAGIGYNGTLKLEICGEPGEKELPCFDKTDRQDITEILLKVAFN
jgi:hypothetical protein